MVAEHTKIALVTGANKGIGAAVARALAARGLTVVVAARELEAGERVAANLRDVGGKALAVQLNVTDEATVAAAVATITSAYGRLDVLVNNAGITDPADGVASMAAVDAQRRIFEVNVFGALAVTQACLPLLRRAPAGRIVNVSSALGSLGLVAPLDSPYRIPLLGYKASKAALGMLTVELARELQDTRVKVNAAAPGYTATDLNRHLSAGRPSIDGERRGQTPDEAATVIVRLAMLADDGPTGRFVSNEGEIPF